MVNKVKKKPHESNRDRCYQLWQVINTDLPENSVGAELGVLRGDFSEAVLEVIKPSMLYLIDAWEKCSNSLLKNKNRKPIGWFAFSQDEMDECYAEVKKRFTQNNVVVVYKTQTGLTALEDNCLDWVYIDALHDYKSVALDLQVAKQKVKNGGWIAGHDYTDTDYDHHLTNKLSDEFSKEIKLFLGVRQAVDEFVEENQFSLQIIPEYHQFAIKKTIE